jgi:hypothetical protein
MNEEWQWYAAIPATGTSIQFPDLPDALSADRVAPGASYVSSYVLFLQGTLFSGAADFRATWSKIAFDLPSGSYAERITAIQ